MGDIEALARYAQRADAGAFDLLVTRYQGLVFSACRRILGNAGEVEDAVQETFIKLARQAGSVRRNPASWIFTCALNTARDRRRADLARRERETAWVGTAGAVDSRGWRELLPVVDECIAELPPEERELLIECYLLRRTQEAVAAEAGISRPTVRKRLDGAIDLLRKGLRRRGVAVSAALLAAWLAEGACEASVPVALSQSLIKIGLAGIGQAAPGPALAAAAFRQHGAVHVLAGSPEAFAAITPGLLAALPGKAQAMAPGGAIPASPVVVGEVGEVCFGFLRQGLKAPGARAEAEKALKQTAAVLVEVDRQVEGRTPYQISEAGPKGGQPGKLLASILLGDYLALYATVLEYHSGPGRR